MPKIMLHRLFTAALVLEDGARSSRPRETVLEAEEAVLTPMGSEEAVEVPSLLLSPTTRYRHQQASTPEAEAEVEDAPLVEAEERVEESRKYSSPSWLFPTDPVGFSRFGSYMYRFLPWSMHSNAT